MKRRTKEEQNKKEKEKEGKKGRNFFDVNESEPMKRKTNPHLNVWFGLMVWIHPKMAKTASFTTGALVGGESQQPYILAP
jgi:hypothetical protein